MEVVEQFSVVVPVLFVIPAVGAVLSRVVDTDEVAVQPLLPVTVTVNVPFVDTEMLDEVAPVLHK
jgi:hypothetical protein